MSRSIGPILATGAITVANASIVNGRPIDLRVVAATGLAAGAFALAERGWEDGAVALAWVALVTVLFTRLQPGVPSPAESFVKWWNTK
jgi:hypothetical protein